MSLLRNIIFVTFLAVEVSACGFSPLYGETQETEVADARVQQHLQAIDIKVSDNDAEKRSIQEFKTNLERNFGRDSRGVTKDDYVLQITLQGSITYASVKKDKEVTRYSLAYTANYQLHDKNDSRKPLTHGRVRVVGSYDAVESDFATFSAKRDAEKRVMKELARDVTLRLTSYFLNQ